MATQWNIALAIVGLTNKYFNLVNNPNKFTYFCGYVPLTSPFDNLKTIFLESIKARYIEANKYVLVQQWRVEVKAENVSNFA